MMEVKQPSAQSEMYSSDCSELVKMSSLSQRIENEKRQSQSEIWKEMLE